MTITSYCTLFSLLCRHTSKFSEKKLLLMNLISLDPIPWQTQFIGLFWAGIFFLVPRDPKRRYRACSNTNCLTNVFSVKPMVLRLMVSMLEDPCHWFHS